MGGGDLSLRMNLGLNPSIELLIYISAFKFESATSGVNNSTSSKTAARLLLVNIIQLSSGVCLLSRKYAYPLSRYVYVCGCSDGERLQPVTDAVGPSDDPSTVLNLTEESTSLALLA